MAKGGFRIGAGRKKGQKDQKPRAGTEAHAEYEKIQQMLAMGTKAKARFYQEFLIRIANKDGQQKPLNIQEKKLMGQLAIELAPVNESEKKASTDLDADVFLRQVWNDPNIDMALRLRAAEIVHKESNGALGKKEEKAGKAVQAGAGRFAAGAPPLKIVK